MSVNECSRQFSDMFPSCVNILLLFTCRCFMFSISHVLSCSIHPYGRWAWRAPDAFIHEAPQEFSRASGMSFGSQSYRWLRSHMQHLWIKVLIKSGLRCSQEGDGEWLLTRLVNDKTLSVSLTKHVVANMLEILLHRSNSKYDEFVYITF